MKPLIPLIVTSILINSSIADEPRVIIPVLKLEEQIYFTDTQGIANPSNIIKSKPLDNIKIYLPDGTELIGLVTKTEETNREILKVFGDIQNKENTGFGFVLTKDGIFAGAVVFRDTDEVFKLEYVESAKGFMLIKSAKKKAIELSQNKSLTIPKVLL
jgi:hypothetical protein